MPTVHFCSLLILRKPVPRRQVPPKAVATSAEEDSAKTSVVATTPGKKKGKSTRTDTEMGPTPSKKVPKKAQASEAAMVALDTETLSKAKGLSMDAGLMNLASRPEIQGKGFSAVP